MFEDESDIDTDFAEEISNIEGDSARDNAEQVLLSLLSSLGYSETVESYEKLRSKYVGT